MNIVFFVGFMVPEIPRVSIFGYCPCSVTFPYMLTIYTNDFSVGNVIYNN